MKYVFLVFSLITVMAHDVKVKCPYENGKPSCCNKQNESCDLKSKSQSVCDQKVTQTCNLKQESKVDCVCNKPKTIVKYKTKYKTKYVDRVIKKPVVKKVVKKVYVKKKPKVNSLSLLGHYGRFSYELQDGGTRVSEEFQPDVGIMYQRDVSDSFRLSIGGTVRGTGTIGVGYNW